MSVILLCETHITISYVKCHITSSSDNKMQHATICNIVHTISAVQYNAVWVIRQVQL